MWFAFKLISLSYWIQPPLTLFTSRFCCDLLSNLYLCHIEYSDTDCFHISEQLWFAFKLISLSYWIQLYWPEMLLILVVICFQTYIFVILNTAVKLRKAGVNCCDLLSNLYLCHIEYSSPSAYRTFRSVVICFQTYIFVILNTAVL